MAARSPPAGSPVASTCRHRCALYFARGVAVTEIRFPPMAIRKEAWARLENDIDMQKLAQMTMEIGLDGVIDAGKKIVMGGVRGRLVVKIG
jgi:acrylyl-CoA reductase (NADPH)